MTRHLAAACAAVLLLATGSLVAQQKATITGVPEIPFTPVPNFLKLPPGEYLGESVAVATNSKGHIFVYHRRDTTRLFEFDRNGNFVKEIGKGYYGFEFAHSVRVDKDDNIWTVDEGTNMVTKFSPDGKVLMVLGRRPPAVDGPVVFPRRPESAGAEVRILPPDRRRLGSAGQHLRLRRLLQQPRREVSTRTAASSRRPAARRPARGSASSTCRTDCRWTSAATCGSPIAPTTAIRCSTTT